jgi:hypothetical protein
VNLDDFTTLGGHRTLVAEWASIIAPVLSLYIVLTIKRVRRKVLDRARLPAAVDALTRSAGHIARLMQSYEENKNEVGLEISKCAVHLRALNAKKSALGSSTKQLLAEIRRYRGWSLLVFSFAPRDDRAAAWRIYTDLNCLIQELTYTMGDQARGG